LELKETKIQPESKRARHHERERLAFGWEQEPDERTLLGPIPKFSVSATKYEIYSPLHDTEARGVGIQTSVFSRPKKRQGCGPYVKSSEGCVQRLKRTELRGLGELLAKREVAV